MPFEYTYNQQNAEDSRYGYPFPSYSDSPHSPYSVYQPLSHVWTNIHHSNKLLYVLDESYRLVQSLITMVA